MQLIQEKINAIAEKARQVHVSERRLTLESVELVGELETMRVAMFLGLTREEFCKTINITVSQYGKRVRIDRLFRAFPRAKEIFLKGETELSCLAIVAGKITRANAEVLLDGMRGMSKREVEAFAAKIGPDGKEVEEKLYHNIFLRLDEEELALLNRARDVMSHGGKMPMITETVLEALEMFLEKKDPMRKAARAEERASKMESKKSEAQKSESKKSQEPEAVATKTETSIPGELHEKSQVPEKPIRKYIPAQTVSKVWLRDGGQCTYTGISGARCPARSILEIDHIIMVCRGGDNSLSNLRLRCRHHNQGAATLELGAPHMKRAAG